jgi:fatty acid desaturase
VPSTCQAALSVTPSPYFYRDLYRQLREEAQAAGVFEPAPWFHPLWLTAAVGLYALGYCGLLLVPSLPLRLLAAGLVAFSTLQLGLLAHEAGHSAVSRQPGLRGLVGHLCDTLLAGVSFSYWNSTHNPHHTGTQRLGDDPDLRFATFSMDLRSARERRGFGRWFTRHQVALLPLGIALWGFSLRFDGWVYALRQGRRGLVDLSLLILHAVLWIAVPVSLLGWPAALGHYALVTLITGPYMGGLFVVNHVGMPVLETGDRLPFLLHQIRTSRNFGQGWLRDVICCGLNLQIEHHLFPSVPYLRLRRLRPLVQRLCEQNDIPYRDMSFLGACREVTRHLAEVARAAR